jgi:hypothetical protein
MAEQRADSWKDRLIVMANWTDRNTKEPTADYTYLLGAAIEGPN